VNSYSSKFGSNSLGEPLFHKDFALFYQNKLEYIQSQRHYLRSETYKDHAAMLIEWGSRGYKSELDLFIARTVLQYLCLENIDGANAVFENFVQSLYPQAQAQLQSQPLSIITSGPLDTPLIHFVQFLLKTVERDASPLFQMLRQKYAPSLERDTAFSAYLNKVGEVYFGLKAPQGMLANILDLMSSK